MLTAVLERREKSYADMAQGAQQIGYAWQTRLHR
jgi:hypothetical protein